MRMAPTIELAKGWTTCSAASRATASLIDGDGRCRPLRIIMITVSSARKHVSTPCCTGGVWGRRALRLLPWSSQTGRGVQAAQQTVCRRLWLESKRQLHASREL